MQDLVIDLMQFVQVDLSPSNCVEYYLFAQSYKHYGSEDLLQSLSNFMIDNFSSIYVEDFRLLPFDAMLMLVSSDHLCVDEEMQVYRTVRLYMELNPNKEKREILLAQVRLQLLSEEDRKKIGKDSDLMQQEGGTMRTTRANWGEKKQWVSVNEQIQVSVQIKIVLHEQNVKRKIKALEQQLEELNGLQMESSEGRKEML
ncbi:hypothetical protein Ciccas_011247, partial [Cichlidogyrus casuarinus]